MTARKQEDKYVEYSYGIMDDERLDIYAIHVLLALMRNLDFSGEDMWVFTGQETLAERARCTEKTVRSRLKLLQKLGYITQVKKVKAAKGYMRNEYKLNPRAYKTDGTTGTEDRQVQVPATVTVQVPATDYRSPGFTDPHATDSQLFLTAAEKQLQEN